MLAEPASVFEGLALTLEGEAAGGRRVVVLRADPKPPIDDSSGVGRSGLGDRHRIPVDLETGLPVRTESFFEGKPVERTTVDELAVGTPIPDRTFTYVPAPDARVLDDEALQPVELSIAAAAGRVPFPLWAPSGFAGNVSLFPDLTTGSDVVVIPMGGAGAGPISVTERSATALNNEGRRVVRQGIDVLVLDEENPGPAAIAVVRGGTRIDIEGPGTPEERADLALSFHRVPTP